MRHALPIWYGLPLEIQEKLTPLLSDPLPPPEWTEWLPLEERRVIDENDRLRKIDRFMRQPPSRSRG